MKRYKLLKKKVCLPASCERYRRGTATLGDGRRGARIWSDAASIEETMGAPPRHSAWGSARRVCSFL
jgi:hypothetical protein